MEQNKAQLIELFTDCINKKRFVSQLNSKDEYDLQQRKTEYTFNINTFYRPKIYYQYMQLGILPKDIRPDFLFFYNSGESSIIEIINQQDQLRMLLNEKYKNPKENFLKYLGDYRYVVCSSDINIESVPDSWGILKLDMVEKKKFPHILLIKPALMVKKNFYIESQFLIRSLSISRDKLLKINKISDI